MTAAPAHPVLERFRDPKAVAEAEPPDGERPFVIEHREALLYMLCLAAELEHGLMCEYLFAAFTLKQRVDEGVTEEQLRAIERWRRVRRGRCRARDASICPSFRISSRRSACRLTSCGPTCHTPLGTIRAA